MRQRGPLLAAMSIMLLLQTVPALAHAERVRSVPKEGARVGSPPEILRIDFSEPPIGEANFVVTDGCERDVVEDVTVQNLEIEADLAAGQPGTWNVATRVVSAIDGHATSDTWTFSVKGEADCEAEVAPGAAEDIEDEQESESGANFPLLAFGAGTLLLIVVAVLVRGRSS